MPNVRLTARALSCVAGAILFLTPANAAAQDRMCDPGLEDCRQILIDHIRAENVGLDVAFWFMEDPWIASEVIARWNANVPVRVLMDSRASATNWRNQERLDELAAAGIPMRERYVSGIMHWKMMLFAGQGIVQFSGANYSSSAWVYYEPLANYVDEAIIFTTKPSVVNTFKTKYDDLWTDTTAYRDYANITQPLWRVYDTYPFDPELNFPPNESYAVRAINEYYAETQKMDVIMYRITDRRHTDALIDLHGRGLPIRLISDPQQYRDATRLWHSWNIDRLYMAGIPIKMRTHAGLNHQKSVILYGRQMSIFGSSNWTSPSAHSQEEHNYFTHEPWIFQWLVNQFERKWNNLGGVEENGPFTPLPPGQPSLPEPAHQSTGVSTTDLVLRWDGSPWAHLYDIYLGTDPTALELLAQNIELGPSQYTGHLRSFVVSRTLNPGTLYYWRIVGKTMANMTAESPLWTFTTTGSAPAPAPLPSPWTSQDVGAVALAGVGEYSNGTFTVRGSGADIWDSADAFHFVSQPVSGDVDILARVASVENVHHWTKAGVMIRESLTAGSRHAFMLASAGRGLAFQRRLETDGLSTGTSLGTGAAPVWVKLERRGNVISAFTSPDGAVWSLVGSDTFAMGADVHVGLAITSHDNTRIATATFDGVVVTTAAGEPDPEPNTPPSVTLTEPTEGASYTAPATVTVSATAADTDGTIARVEFFAGTTLIGTATAEPYSITWTDVPAGSYQLTARAVDDDGGATVSTAVMIRVDAPPTSLPSPWNAQDIGTVGVAGTASESGGTFTVAGSGADVWGAADGFYYVWQQVSGDIDIVARVASVEYVHQWTKAGVMIRGGLDASAAHGFMLVSAGKGLAFQRRVAAGGDSTHTSGGGGTAPVWVKLERRGSTLNAYASGNGADWTLVGSDSFAFGTNVYVGLAVTSHDNSRTATATFDNVSVLVPGGDPPPPPPPPLPAGWASADVGAVGYAGSAVESGGTYTVQASGADIWGTADGLHFAYQQVTGDVDIIARVASVEYVHAWTKAAVMIRGSLAAGSAHGMMLASAGKGYAFQRRLEDGGLSYHTAGPSGTAPGWVKLERRSNTVTAYHSADGVSWTLVGSEVLTLPGTAYVGLALTSHDNARLATATFDNVSIVPR